MNRSVMVLIAGCAMSMAAAAATCNQSTWTFSAGSGGAQCGTYSNGVTFTQGGETITIFPELLSNGNVVSNPSTGNPVYGLFEVGKGQNGNLASGIAPFISGNVNGEGGSPYTSQQGIQEGSFSGTTYDAMLYIEVNQSSIPSGSTLSFLMQEGDVADTFSVFTSVGSSSTPPNLGSMTPDGGVMNVGPMNGGATTPQFSIKTNTSALNPIEFIAIKADCTYLLLNSISVSTPSVPEPRFYGFLLAGLIGLAGVVYQRRRSASQPV